ncbi:hypothetical protein BGY98DRAFT_1104466 [Russula aff. rugulosa BPL654]|nr:hypothetical protein BGY98DRAFT_1104466 [Russula aff. rugulosa BPL654]
MPGCPTYSGPRHEAVPEAGDSRPSLRETNESQPSSHAMVPSIPVVPSNPRDSAAEYICKLPSYEELNSRCSLLLSASSDLLSISLYNAPFPSLPAFAHRFPPHPQNLKYPSLPALSLSAISVPSIPIPS